MDDHTTPHSSTLSAATVARTRATDGPRVTTEDYAAPARTPDGHDLTTQQLQTLEQLLTFSPSVDLIRALDGDGKTTIDGLARAEFERHGFRVVGVASTLQALAELGDVGLRTRETPARTAMADGEFSTVMRTMDHRTVVIVDKGSSSSLEGAPSHRG